MPRSPSVRTVCSSVLRDWSARADTARPRLACEPHARSAVLGDIAPCPKRNARCVINETRRGLSSYRSRERPRAALSVLAADTGAGRAAARPAPRGDRPRGGEAALPARAPPRPRCPAGSLAALFKRAARRAGRAGRGRAGCAGTRCGHGGADPAPAAGTASRHRPPRSLQLPPPEK